MIWNPGSEHVVQHHKSACQRWRHGKDFRHARSRGCCGTDWSMCIHFSLDKNHVFLLVEYGWWFQENDSFWSIVPNWLHWGHLWFNPLHHQRKTPCRQYLFIPSLESEQRSLQQRSGRHSDHRSGRRSQSSLWHWHPRGEDVPHKTILSILGRRWYSWRSTSGFQGECSESHTHWCCGTGKATLEEEDG